MATDRAQENPYPHQIHDEKYIERNEFAVARGDDVVGRLAVVRLEKGDTLPDVARHFGLGITAIGAANPGVDLWAPAAGKRVMLPLSFILPDTPRRGIVINVAAMRLFRYKGDSNRLTVLTFPVGIGSKEWPTPMGKMSVKRKEMRPTWHVPSSILKAHRKKGDPLPAIVPPGPQNPLGEMALYLSKSGYLIHGTNKPASIGLKATHGCMRLYPEDMKRLYDDTPYHTPVLIVNQPLLIGQLDGVLYLEAHAHNPVEQTDDRERKRVFARLQLIERQTGRPLDWKKIEKVSAEARGIPVPIARLMLESRDEAPTTEVKHPAKLYGKPEIPELKLDAWYVLAANVANETEARRIAAMINHQGPPIPARVLMDGDRYRVMAGPFKDVAEADDAIKRLKFDLELSGILVEPVSELVQKLVQQPPPGA
ncbi:MAG TPA: L,D-transpeptidase family protein [Geomonas sp.]|nr:L,D-transpeptidase family protein [Geomonas sp.]